MKTKDFFRIYKRPILSVLGIFFCCLIILTGNKTFEIDKFSGKIKISFHVFGFTLHSSEKNTDFSILAKKYATDHSPIWKTDTRYQLLSGRKVSDHLHYHGAIADTRNIAKICLNSGMPSEDQKILIQRSLILLEDYEKNKIYFSRVNQYFESSNKEEKINWNEIFADASIDKL